LEGTAPAGAASKVKAGQAPSMPAWLSREGKAEWRRVVDYLVRHCGLLPCDRAALANYCMLVGDVHRLRRALEEKGETYTTPSGIVRARPEVGMLSVAVRNLRGWAGELGLTPEARLRLEGGAGGTGSSALDEYLGELSKAGAKVAGWGEGTE